MRLEITNESPGDIPELSELQKQELMDLASVPDALLEEMFAALNREGKSADGIEHTLRKLGRQFRMMRGDFTGVKNEHIC